MGIGQEKYNFMVEEYRKNQNLKGIQLNALVKAKFGTGADGSTIKRAVAAVNPNYDGYAARSKRKNKFEYSSIANEVTSMSKVGINKLYEAGATIGITAGTIRALVLQATRKVKFVPDFTAEQLEKAKESLIKDNKVCFCLSRTGKIYLVDSDRVVIKDKRGKNGEEISST